MSAPQEAVRLWPGAAPGSEKWMQKEVRFTDTQFGGETIRNVVEPTLSVFLPPPSTANATAVIICPGGAFQALSWNNEGTEMASWLNKQGVALFVLKYRLANTGETDADFRLIWETIVKKLMADSAQEVAALAPEVEVAATDGRRAVQLVRQNATKWRIAPDRIGILGFSAGAAIAIDVGAQHDELSRPNFVSSIYGPSLRRSRVPLMPRRSLLHARQMTDYYLATGTWKCTPPGKAVAIWLNFTSTQKVGMDSE